METDALKYKRRKIRKLSLEFCKHVKKDLGKSILIYPKIILECISLWPGKDNWAMKMINYAGFISFSILEIAHVTYLLGIINNISEAAHVCITVSSVLQTVCKILSLRYNKQRFNEILTQIWNDFWPVDLASKETQKTIKMNMLYIKIMYLIYLCLGLMSVTQFASFPLIIGNDMLPIASKYPFDYKKVPYFEMMYMWQYLSTFIIVCTISGYDFLFSSVVMNVVAQFQILQDVMKNIYVGKTKKWKMEIYHKLGINQNCKNKERELFVKCIKHHNMLLLLCRKMEKCYSFMIFIQFFVSSMALCVSSLVLTTKQEEVGNMFIYAMAHLIQLFILCSTGNELIYQSLEVGDAAAECGYQYNFDKDIRHGLLMIVQRSQREIKLTALGFTDLSYRSFLMVLSLLISNERIARLAFDLAYITLHSDYTCSVSKGSSFSTYVQLLRATFSFYTMLESFK